MRYFFLLLLTSFFLTTSHAQMWNGQDSLYGNEWLQYDQTYFKIAIAEDGIYRIPFATLSPHLPNNFEGKNLQIFAFGEEIPIYTSTENTFSTSDYIEFYGTKNRSELDIFLYENAKSQLLNPQYSMFTDTAIYYLTWNNSGAHLRYETIINDINNPNLPTKETSFTHTQLSNFVERHFLPKPQVHSSTIEFSAFLEGEGYGASLSNNSSIELTPEHPAPQDDAELRIRFATHANIDHYQILSINNEPIVQDTFFGYKLRDYTTSINNVDLHNPINLSLEGTAPGNDRHSISNIILNYPRLFNFGGASSFSFPIEASNNLKYLEIENFEANNTTPLLYDLTNYKRILATLDGDLIKIALPSSLEERDLILTNQTAIQVINDIEPVTFENYLDLQGNFIIITHPTLYDDGNGNNWIQEYADFKASSLGGGLNPIIIDINQLYEQFAYGIQRHPLSIRNFIHFIEKNWTNPDYVFIIGKAREYRDLRTSDQIATHTGVSFFVPTYGVPGGDQLLAAFPNKLTPTIPIGRLAAKNTDHIKLYFDKVVEFESNKNLPQTLEDREWMKGVLHLGGGGNAGEQSSIRNHLQSFEGIIETSSFAGSVRSFFKTSTDPIQMSQSQSIRDAINGGLSIITFFGHSSPNTFDFSIDDPSFYTNKGRYPLMFSFGCYSGRCHVGTESIGEQFVLIPEKGAIAYISSVGQGFISSLRLFGDQFYENLGNDMYGEGIGDIFQKASRELESMGLAEKLLIQQMTLQGDPSLRLNPQPGPDYLVDISSARIDPPLVNIKNDSFDLHFSTQNIGRAADDSLTISIDREFPNGNTINLLNKKVTAPLFKNDFSVTLPVGGEAALGQNRIKISVDSENTIEELPSPNAESNNDLLDASGREGIPFLIISNDIIPAYPIDYSIVNNSDLELKAYTADIFAAEQKFLFELDTTNLFNSPIKQSHESIREGGVIKWKPSTNFTNNRVYYWRVSPDSIDNTGYRWRNSSFLFQQDGASGWNQSHFYQYQPNEFTNTEIPNTNRTLKFIDDIKDIRIRNVLHTSNQWPEYFINNLAMNSEAGAFPGVIVGVLDSVTVQPWEDMNNAYGDDATGKNGFAFKTHNLNNRTQLINFLEDTIPSGNYVILFTRQNNSDDYSPDEWAMDSISNGLGINLFEVLEKQGATMVRNFENTGALPYGFVYKKDDPSYNPHEYIGTVEEGFDVTFQIESNWDEGMIKSIPIGPARKWESFKWQISDYDPISDDVSVNLYGLRLDGTDSLIYKNLTAFDTSLAQVSTDLFPYLQIEFNARDSAFRTPPQLDHWRVLYEGLPESTLDPGTYFTLDSDTIEQGAILKMGIAIENISDFDMDSLLVHYKILDSVNEEIQIAQRLKPLLTQDTLIANFQLDTRELGGHYQLIIEVNPNEDQPELTKQNNFGFSQFFVERDQRNPLLNVTFDGVHIMDGDIISHRPNIVIQLQDENKYLELADTSLFNILLQSPSSGDPKKIFFDEQIMRFFPADPNNLEKENKATIEYTPELLEDGIYTLLVQARDAAGNQSGRADYKITFEIITKAMISNVLNYPNPFSTSTSFVYTLTGTEPPAYFKMQIMTVSGRVVREITQNELGALKIGTHKTDYTWDGTDQFGDKLANGVYLYRIIAQKANGEDYENFETKVDQYFKEGFGKMVIIR